MSMNSAPASERAHIGFFGCRNAGKSSLVNAVTGQPVSVVSEVKGTTTDPVQKAMEILPLGPVVIIDTPGFDDEGSLGEKRVETARRVLRRTDAAVLVADAVRGLTEQDRALLELFRAREIPYVIAWNKRDLLPLLPDFGPDGVAVSALTGAGVWELKERIARILPEQDSGRRLVGDLVSPGDAAVLVCPIDESAPRGRLILPQQQTVRDLLDAGACALVTRETELREALDRLAAPPKLVITDSQVFGCVSRIVPDAVPLTSFSILMARYKGFLRTAVAGVAAVDRLLDGDRILMAEGCTHHRQCRDIGTVKIPGWLRAHTGRKLVIETSSGTDFPEDLSPYALVIHCGGCMITQREVQYRMRAAEDQNVPFTNYGIAIARMTGTLERSVRLFPEIHALLEAER